MESRFVYLQLQTADIEEAKRFYSQLFGWSLIDDPPSSGPPYTEVWESGDKIAGIMSLPPTVGSSRWIPYVSVDDVDLAIARARELGAEIAVAAMDIAVKGCRIGVIVDPSGATVALRGPLGP